MDSLIPRPTVSIAVPVYRNAATLEDLYNRVVATLEPDTPDFELLLVDDGSPDNSWEVISALAIKDERVKAISLSRNFGQHPAISAAFERARGEQIILMDADLEDRPEGIPALLEKLVNGADIVYTIKTGKLNGFGTRVTSFVFHQTFSRIAGVDVPPEIGTFRAFSRKVLNALRAHKEYNILYGPLMFTVGFTTAFVEVQRDPRPNGMSAYTFTKRLALAVRSLASYSDLPIRLFLTIGFAALLLTMAYLIITLTQYFVFDIKLPGGLTIVIFMMSFFFSIIMLSLGVIGAYLFSVFQEVLDRPRYLVANEINVNAEDAADPATFPSQKAP